MSAATGEQVDVDVDLDARVPCPGLMDVGVECPRTAVFLVTIRHPVACIVPTRSSPLCGRCTERLRQAVRHELIDCRVCCYVVRPEDLEVRPL